MQKTLAITVQDDTPAIFGLEVYRGVCRFVEGPPGDPDFTLIVDRDILNAIVTGIDTYAAALGEGRVEVTGDHRGFSEFMELFEDPWESKPPLTLR